MSWTCPTCKRDLVIIGDCEDLGHLRRAVGALRERGDWLEERQQHAIRLGGLALFAICGIAIGIYVGGRAGVLIASLSAITSAYCTRFS